MKKTISRLTALLLVAVMMLPAFCIAAFATTEDFTPEGHTVDFETAIYKEIGGAWAKVTRVNPGDAVKVRVFAKTDYVAGNAEFTLFYNENFFSSAYPISFSNSIVYNSTPGFFTVEEEFGGTFAVKGSTPKDIFPLYKSGVITSEFFDSHGYFMASVDFLDRKTTYDNSDWMCEFDLTVKNTATGVGDVCIFPGSECNSVQTSNVGLNFPVFDTAVNAAIGAWLWQGNYGFEPVYNISSTPVGVPGAAMSVSLDESKLTLKAGESKALVETVLPADTEDKTVTWSSSDENVASVEGGVVTAVGNGNAVITVTTNDGGFTDSCEVTVNTPIAELSFDKSKFRLAPGGSETITPTILPATANLTELVWESSNEDVATVVNGVVAAHSEGTALITAKPKDNQNNIPSTSCTVKVAYAVEGIEFNSDNVNISIGETQQLLFTITPANATDKSVTWSSEEPDIASVDSNGVVTAHKNGTARITVKTNDGKFSDTCTVFSVTPLTALSFNVPAITVKPGESVTIEPSYAPNICNAPELIWSSSNPDAVTVEGNAIEATFTGVSQGSSVISAVPKYNPNNLPPISITVTVKYPVEGIQLSSGAINLDAGKSATLSATITPANATNKDVSWSSSAPSVASVDSNGVVSGISSGSAVITAESADGNFKATCTVTVKQRVSGVRISQEAITVKYKKESPTLTAWIEPENADNKNITWSSENEKIARVDQNGKITARDMGTTYIVATSEDGELFARCKVTVTMTFFQRIIRWFKILFGTWNTAMGAFAITAKTN